MRGCWVAGEGGNNHPLLAAWPAGAHACLVPRGRALPPPLLQPLPNCPLHSSLPAPHSLSCRRAGDLGLPLQLPVPPSAPPALLVLQRNRARGVAHGVGGQGAMMAGWLAGWLGASRVGCQCRRGRCRALRSAAGARGAVRSASGGPAVATVRGGQACAAHMRRPVGCRHTRQRGRHAPSVQPPAAALPPPCGVRKRRQSRRLTPARRCAVPLLVPCRRALPVLRAGLSTR